MKLSTREPLQVTVALSLAEWDRSTEETPGILTTDVEVSLILFL